MVLIGFSFIVDKLIINSMKKVDFSKLKVQLTFEGAPVEIDFRKVLGNLIHQSTPDIGLDTFARTIYFSDGEVEVPDEYIEPILRIASQGLNVPAQNALNELLRK